MSELDENTVKHLEMIQTVVTRLAQNSFAFKAWAVTLVSAIVALSLKDQSLPFVLVALLPAFVFWGLDAYYLRQERLFCRLYDVVRGAFPDTPPPTPFTMDARLYTELKPKVSSWLEVCCSPSVLWLYGPIIAVILICAITLVCGGQCQSVAH